MPLIQSSPWQDAAGVGKGLGNAIGEILLQLPQLRAQQAARQQELLLQQQHLGLQRDIGQSTIGLHNQQRDLALARTQQITNNAAKEKSVADTIQRISGEFQANGEVSPRSAGEFARAIATSGKNPAQLAEGLSKLFGTLNSGVMNDPAKAFALAGGDVRKTTPPLHNVGSGQIAVNPSGQQVAQGPMNIAPGHQVAMPPTTQGGTGQVFTNPSMLKPSGASDLPPGVLGALAKVFFGEGQPGSGDTNVVSRIPMFRQAIAAPGSVPQRDTTGQAQAQQGGEGKYLKTAVHASGSRIGLIAVPSPTGKGETYKWVPIQ